VDENGLESPPLSDSNTDCVELSDSTERGWCSHCRRKLTEVNTYMEPEQDTDTYYSDRKHVMVKKCLRQG
jgi:predicted Fe-S protein YdhL (DUF1289 family)